MSFVLAICPEPTSILSKITDKFLNSEKPPQLASRIMLWLMQPSSRPARKDLLPRIKHQKFPFHSFEIDLVIHQFMVVDFRSINSNDPKFICKSAEKENF